MSKVRTQQFIVIGVIAVIIAFLFTRDVKGLVKEETEQTTEAAVNTMPETTGLTLEEESRIARNLVGSQFTKEIIALEAKFQSAKDEERIKLAQELASKWQDVEQSTASALYLEIIALEKRGLNDWINAGDRFITAYESQADSLKKPSILMKANVAYNNALAIDSSNLSAKTGAGITIVNGMGAPMEGISMLLDVVNQDPKNLKALMQLGLFSVRSGQFDKAIERFKSVLEIKKSFEAYFFLATAYENLDRNEEAIEAYINSKNIVASPTMIKFIDSKVAELKNK